jgi:hypothetical protein
MYLFYLLKRNAYNHVALFIVLCLLLYYQFSKNMIIVFGISLFIVRLYSYLHIPKEGFEQEEEDQEREREEEEEEQEQEQEQQKKQQNEDNESDDE